MPMREALSAIIEGRYLTRDQAREVMDAIMTGNATPAQFGALVTALRMRGESDEEIAGFAEVMRDKALRVPLPPGYQVVDCCGTGGDKSNTFNISTAAAIEAAPEQVARCVQEVGIGFMYAPSFHPAMRFAGPPRREIGIRTVFNILGPLTNPAYAQQQLVGVAERALVEQLGRVLALMGTRHAIMVHGLEGLDEVSISGPTLVCEVRGGHPGSAHPAI